MFKKEVRDFMIRVELRLDQKSLEVEHLEVIIEKQQAQACAMIWSV